MNDTDLIRRAREQLDEAKASVITPKTMEALRRVEADLNELENRMTRRVLGMGDPETT